MDRAWWAIHIDEVRFVFEGRLLTSLVHCFGAESLRVGDYKNSGAGAIVAAVYFGARKIILLGYDCQHTGGQAHWHGDHPKGLGNAGSLDKWPAQFQRLARDLRNFNIVNSTRETALICFPRVALEHALRDKQDSSDLALGREQGLPA